MYIFIHIHIYRKVLAKKLQVVIPLDLEIIGDLINT